jgi:hypothetical protein
MEHEMKQAAALAGTFAAFIRRLIVICQTFRWRCSYVKVAAQFHFE